MKKDISIVVPSIRPQNLIKFYNSAEKACKSYSFEVVIPSPYLIPEELLRKENVKFIHTYANPTISFQIAALHSNAEFIYNTTDDGLIQENVLDQAIKTFGSNLLYDNDMINMTYVEDVLDPVTLELKVGKEVRKFPAHYWLAGAYKEYDQPGINPKWWLCPHFFMKLDYFLKIGGFDCGYEYSNHALHDLAFRVQAEGGRVFQFPEIAFLCSHLEGKTGDHGPVNDAQLGPDTERFNKNYSKLLTLDRINLNYNDWKNYPNIWIRRFDPSNLKLQP